MSNHLIPQAHIYLNVMSHLESLSIISNNQFGFRAKRSAEQQLFHTIHDFAFNLSNKSQTDVILLDFCKAFDKVSHRLLLHKLDIIIALQVLPLDGYQHFYMDVVKKLFVMAVHQTQ